MSKLDEEIRKTLLEGASEQELKDLAEEKNLFQELGGLFRGKNKIPVILNYFGLVFFFGVGIFALIRFLNSEDPQQTALYAMLLVLSFIAILAYKMWLWMQMNRNATTREILRLELRLIEIQKTLKKK